MTMQYRTPPQIGFNFGELIVDSFAGGGGASTGIEAALGRPVDIAINHDEQAIAMHTVNHPQTRHYCESVWEVDPREACQGRPVGLAWFSPDCRHFSKAKGGTPVSPRVRGLAWVVLRWIGTVRPRVVILENVEEFKTWGPVVRNGDGDYMPCKKRRGNTFNSFLNAIRRQGYQVETRELRACDFGAPTIRKRLFLIARCDGQPITWPEPTHGPGLQSYRTAADIIDWNIPCPSIFDRKRPLAENTQRRIARGIQRFVIDNPEPYIVGKQAQFLTEHANGSNPRSWSAAEPLRTQVASIKGGHFALVTAFLAKHFGGVTGVNIDTPYPTITTRGTQNQVVTAHLTRDAGTGRGEQVRAFLMKYYSEGGQWQALNEPMHTIPTKARMGLVMVKGEPYQVVDIGMRMLEPHELFKAQGFPADYIIDRDGTGHAITKTQQVAKCGNSVCPPLAEALVRANMAVAAIPMKEAA
ncbi:DNA cytosine methyltransferase [Microbulbifer sp. HZ11]|uniref:DNA cytosine methyltransferase n=1 Tax=Microbulbifer sp. HZ11 TaxID=1453501 RepID=UPI0009E0848D|nr:DNA cytosine methyltransferase [Microbulbifer sp. HZ11]